MADITLSDIAKYAYGSGYFEGKKGGAGNVGMLNGKVVKFNTHHDDRGGVATLEMKKSCDTLRLQMYDLVRSAYDDVNIRGKGAQLAKIRQQLGLSDDGSSVVSTKLLDRKTVATIVNQLERNLGRQIWNLRPREAVELSSDGKDTKFSTAFKTAVDERMQETLDKYMGNVATSVDDFAENLAHKIAENPLEEKVSLDTGARQLMIGIIRESIVDAMGRSDGFYTGTGDGLRFDYEGSTFDLLKHVDLKSTDLLVLARSLPADKARAFLKACTLFGDISVVPGLGTRLHAVAGQLAELKDGQFTVANVIRLAYPGEKQLAKTVAALCQNGRVPDKKMSDFGFAVTATVANKNGEALMEKNFAIAMQRDALLQAGFKPSDVRLIMANPANFSRSMIPPSFFLFGFRSLVGDQQDAAMKLMLGDLSRNNVSVTIKQQDGKLWTPSENIRLYRDNPDAAKSDVEQFEEQLKGLCGESDVMRDNICYFLSQNAQTPESILGSIFGHEPNRFDAKASFTFERCEDGSVLAKRTGDPFNEVPLDSEYRFYPDGRIVPVSVMIHDVRNPEVVNKAAGHNIDFRKDKNQYGYDFANFFAVQLAGNVQKGVNALENVPKQEREELAGFDMTCKDLKRGFKLRIGNTVLSPEAFNNYGNSDVESEALRREVKSALLVMAQGDDDMATCVGLLTNQHPLASAMNVFLGTVQKIYGSAEGTASVENIVCSRCEDGSILVKMDHECCPDKMETVLGQYSKIDPKGSYYRCHVEFTVTKLGQAPKEGEPGVMEINGSYFKIAVLADASTYDVRLNTQPEAGA